MINDQQSEFEMVNCFECNAANIAANTHCRQCGAELKKGLAATEIPPWAAWAVIGFVVILAALAITAVVSEQLAGIIVGGLVILAYLVSAAGTLWLIIEAFRESALWGFVCFLAGPIGQLIFLIVHPSRAVKPFIVQLAGIGIFFVTIFLGSFMV